jgi:hypothetical protein
MQQRKPNGTTVLSILLGTAIVLLAANLWRLNEPLRPDPRMVALAVRATVYAVPSPTPRIIEVTRVVAVTVPPPTATATLTPTLTPTGTVTPATPSPADEAALEPQTSEALAAAEAAEAVEAPVAAEAAMAVEGLAADAVAVSAEMAASVKSAPDEVAMVAAEAAEQAFVQAEQAAPAPPAGGCGGPSGAQYSTVPVAGGGLSHPDSLHADLNLSVRGYSPANVDANLVDKNGPVDGDPPQLAGIFGDYRGPRFGQAYKVNDWDWGCGEHGCALGPVAHVDASLIALEAGAGEPLGIPHRGAQVYGGGYKALVLYAEATRITLGYTREDSVANGYAIHLENICVDPNLLALYQASTAAGRGSLPALREDEVLGTASGSVLVAVRDRGVFFDPRSRKDWWLGF